MCGHNPTGVDPTPEQWKEIYTIIQSTHCLPFFDNAYQGFVSGDPDADAFPVRYFVEQSAVNNEPLNMLVCCSFAKNFGLYCERIGALHVVTKNVSEKERVASQLRVISRSMYSSCPAYGARIISYILNDPIRASQWRTECAAMATRLNDMRILLYNTLIEKNVKGTWEHVRLQRGMFTYTGIQATAVQILKTQHHVYLLATGRVSIAGLTPSNIILFVNALVTVLGTNE